MSRIVPWVGLVVSLISVAIAAASFLVSFFWSGLYLTGIDQGEKCLTYQGWVMDRLKEGFSPNEIASLTEHSIQWSGPVPILDSPAYTPCGLKNGEDVFAFALQVSKVVEPTGR
jgi:hypothetical protein